MPGGASAPPDSAAMASTSPDAGLTTRAPAKVNLTLHVLGRRADDGYHELESLVVFAGVSDLLTLLPGPNLSLSVDGPTAPAAGPVDDNLVLKAARRLGEYRPGLRVGAFRLVKRLPAAAGIGGGSSDAAAALRLLGHLNGLAPDDPTLLAAARETGADVPVCLDPRARMMLGAGERVGAPLGLRPMFGLLVNPGVAVPTPDVFRAIGLGRGDRTGRGEHAPVPPGASAEVVAAVVAAGGNDLQHPAVSLQPIIGAAVARVAAQPGCRLARMSGSGATVFGLFADCHAAARAARAVRSAEPTWWVKPTTFR